MTDFDRLCENAISELNKITEDLTDERNCASCKHGKITRDYTHRDDQYFNLKCEFESNSLPHVLKDPLSDKFIGRFHKEDLQIRNRRYSFLLHHELPRRRMTHKCKNHEEGYKFRIF